MKIKICGVTTVDDALLAAEAGADMIGLNFYPRSPRYVSLEKAQAIAEAIHRLPHHPVLVGVFVNELPEKMNTLLDECGLDFAQLSGDEPPETLAALNGRAFKVVRENKDLTGLSDLSGLSPQRPDFLFDANVSGQFGGTGQTADWKSAAEMAQRCRLLLAGGLTPENVAEAIRRVRPWGVDVASGVEVAPGKKDEAKVRGFIATVREVSNGLK